MVVSPRQTTVEDNVAMEKSGTRDTIKESCILLWKGLNEKRGNTAREETKTSIGIDDSP